MITEGQLIAFGALGSLAVAGMLHLPDIIRDWRYEREERTREDNSAQGEKP